MGGASSSDDAPPADTAKTEAPQDSSEGAADIAKTEAPQDSSEGEHGWFNAVAEQWADYASSSPQFEFCYAYSIFKLVGDMTGKHVLDMPSGSGEQTERCLQMGAASVTSVDISPEQLKLCRHRVERRGWLDRWQGHVGDATEPIPALSTGEHDALVAFFLFEYCATVAHLEAMASNLFAAAKPGAPLAVLYFPCVNDPEDIAHVVDVVGAECTAYSPTIAPGDKVTIKWHNTPDKLSCEVFHWPVEYAVAALEKAGFTDVRVARLETDPAYNGTVDVARFAAHTENRSIYARRP